MASRHCSVGSCISSRAMCWPSLWRRPENGAHGGFRTDGRQTLLSPSMHQQLGGVLALVMHDDMAA